MTLHLALNLFCIYGPSALSASFQAVTSSRKMYAKTGAKVPGPTAISTHLCPAINSILGQIKSVKWQSSFAH